MGWKICSSKFQGNGNGMAMEMQWHHPENYFKGIHCHRHGYCHSEKAFQLELLPKPNSASKVFSMASQNSFSALHRPDEHFMVLCPLGTQSSSRGSLHKMPWWASYGSLPTFTCQYRLGTQCSSHNCLISSSQPNLRFTLIYGHDDVSSNFRQLA